jgi:hypothetical protein
METTQNDGNASFSERASQIHCARKLIRLNTNQANDRFASGPMSPRNSIAIDFLYDLIDQGCAYIEFSQPAQRAGFLGQPCQTEKGIAGEYASNVAYDVSIVVVVGRLDQEEVYLAYIVHRMLS